MNDLTTAVVLVTGILALAAAEIRERYKWDPETGAWPGWGEGGAGALMLEIIVQLAALRESIDWARYEIAALPGA